VSLRGLLHQLELLLWLWAVEGRQLEPGTKVHRVNGDTTNVLQVRERPADEACLRHVLAKLVGCPTHVPGGQASIANYRLKMPAINLPHNTFLLFKGQNYFLPGMESGWLGTVGCATFPVKSFQRHIRRVRVNPISAHLPSSSG
jgi:hypothetical protein